MNIVSPPCRWFSRNTVLALPAWTLVLAASLLWNVRNEHAHTALLIKTAAQTHVNRILALREWIAEHGGIYARVDERTEPNPLLDHIPERDLTTPSGKRLTLINPAYAVRLIEEYTYKYGVHGHITSLRHQRPETAPDAWEARALRRFEQGVPEVQEMIDREDGPYLRFMQPLITQEACLQCHAGQGYETGDIRGGISVNVAMRPYLEIEALHIQQLYTFHALLWALGIAIAGIIEIFRRSHCREREEASRQLQQSSAQVRLLLESTAEGIYGLDREGRCTFCNPAAAHLLGYRDSEELLGRDMHGIIHHTRADGSAYPRQECPAHQALPPDEKIHLEDELFWRAGGSAFPVELRVRAVRDGDEVVGTVVTFNDITERKLAEAALRASEARLRDVFRFSPLGIVTADSNGMLLDTNRAFREFIGYSYEELRGLSLIDLTYVDDIEATHGVLAELQPGKPHSHWLEKRYRRKDASLVWGHVWLTRINGPDTPYFVAIIEDITERRRAEEKLRQAAKVFESAAEGVVITDAENRIIAVNRAFSQITGYEEAEALGRNPKILQSGRHGADFYHAMWHSLEKAGQWRGEIWNRRKNGELYPQWLSIGQIKDAQNRVNNYVGVFSDITHIKESEDRLNHLAHHDPLTDLPNRLLFNARLQHAMQRAEREGRLTGILLLDLDRFKTVNETLGHPLGDCLLQAVSKRLMAEVRG